VSSAKGNCLCGAITFCITLPCRWVAHCHCTMCQQMGGAAFVTWVGVDKKHCDIIDLERQLHWYQSSPEAQRGFCGTCGSSLFFHSNRWPDEMHITLSNFQTPVDKVPQMHAFWDTHVDWITLSDELPRKSAQEIFDE
jgi:hypothetical protein